MTDGGHGGLGGQLRHSRLAPAPGGQADGDLVLQQAVGGVVGDALGLVVAALRLPVALLKAVQVAKAS